MTSSVAFIQFRGAVQRGTMDSLRARLAAAGFVAPGVERVDRQFGSAVRYFHVEDRTVADSAAAIARAFLQPRSSTALPIPVQSMAGRGFRAPRGQIEVWISAR